MSKVCVFSTHIQSQPYTGKLNYSNLSFSNFKRYANYHGYDFIGNTTPNPRYFIHNGYDDSPKNLYPYVYQLYQINQLLERYDKIFFIASDMLITKKFGSLDEEFGQGYDYCADINVYNSNLLVCLVKMSNFDSEMKKYLIEHLGQNYSYYFPNSFLISNKASGLYDIQKFKARFAKISNIQLGYPHSNNDLQLLRFIQFTKDCKLITSNYQQNKQYFYNDMVLKYWNNYNEYPHQEILSTNKLPLFCGCGSYGLQFMIRYKLIKDIVTKYPNLVY